MLGGRARPTTSGPEAGYEAPERPWQRTGAFPESLYLDFLPAAAYVAPSRHRPGRFPGKSWISVALGARRGDAWDAGGALAGLAPELLLDEIAWGARSASPAGSSVVGHVPMSRYLVSVDLAKALRAARRAGRPALAAAIVDELHASRSGRVELEAWVNGPGYVGKIKGPVPGSGLGTPAFAFSSFTAKFTPSQLPASATVALDSLRPSSRSLWAIDRSAHDPNPVAATNCSASRSSPSLEALRVVCGTLPIGGSCAFAAAPGRTGYSKSSPLPISF